MLAHTVLIDAIFFGGEISRYSDDRHFYISVDGDDASPLRASFNTLLAFNIHDYQSHIREAILCRTAFEGDGRPSLCF